MKTLELRRWPRPVLANAYLVLLAAMLGGAAWATLTQGFWQALVIVGAVSLFWIVVMAYRTGPRRIRLEVTDERLRVYVLQGRRAELAHDLLRADLCDLWLREVHPVTQGQGPHRATVDYLCLMARTRQHPVLELLLLRDGHLELYQRDQLLAWLTEALDLKRGVQIGPLRRRSNAPRSNSPACP